MTQPFDRGAIARMLIKLFEHWQLETIEQLNSLGLSTNNRAALTRYRNGGPLSKNRGLLDLLTTCSKSTGIYACCSPMIVTWLTLG